MEPLKPWSDQPHHSKGRSQSRWQLFEIRAELVKAFVGEFNEWLQQKLQSLSVTQRMKLRVIKSRLLKESYGDHHMRAAPHQGHIAENAHQPIGNTGRPCKTGRAAVLPIRKDQAGIAHQH